MPFSALGDSESGQFLAVSVSLSTDRPLGEAYHLHHLHDLFNETKRRTKKTVWISICWISKSPAMRVYRHLTRRPLYVLLTSICSFIFQAANNQSTPARAICFCHEAFNKNRGIKMNLVLGVSIDFGSPWVEVFSKHFVQHTYTSLLLNLCHPPIPVKPATLPSCP